MVKLIVVAALGFGLPWISVCDLVGWHVASVVGKTAALSVAGEPHLRLYMCVRRQNLPECEFAYSVTLQMCTTGVTGRSSQITNISPVLTEDNLRTTDSISSFFCQW